MPAPRIALFLLACLPLAAAAQAPPANPPASEEVLSESPPAPRAATKKKTPDYGSKLAWVVEGAVEFGGDTVAKVYFTNGSSQNIKTGQGVTLAAGGQYRASRKSPFAVTGTLGYKFVSSQDANSSLGIDRLTLELTGRYRYTPNGWLGAGVVRHNNIKFDGGGLGPDIRFEDATGLAAELGWRWIAVSYTKIKYQAQAPFTGKANASNFGLIGTYAFD